MGKKDQEKDELAADFFGDADWMDDEDEDEDDDDSEEVEHLPVAPAAETTAEAPKPKDPEAWENKISDAPKDPASLSNAPTLHFSAVPTIPPIDEKETDLAEDMPTATITLPQLPEALPTEEAPRTDAEETEVIDETPEPVWTGPPAPAQVAIPAGPPTKPKPRPAAATASSELDEDIGADPAQTEAPEFFGDELTGEEPLVRTQDPAPGRSAEVTREQGSPAFTPPSDPVQGWEPRGDEASWAEVAGALETAAEQGGAKAADFRRAAARIHHRRLGQPAVAASVLAQIEKPSTDDHLLRAAAHRSAGAMDEAISSYEAAAEAGGTVAAEALLQAMELCRDSDPNKAVSLATRATKAGPDDYAAWSALRDGLAETDGSLAERVAAAEKLAELSTGWAAAEALLEVAGALLGDDEKSTDAIRLLQAARAAAPDHGTVFVVLEDALEAAKDHAALAGLYKTEATREGTRDAGWWWLLAGRALAAAGQDEDADAAFASAAAEGFLGAERERQAAAYRSKSWQSLADSLEREAAALEGPAKAFALYRLGAVRERHLGEPELALQAFEAVLEADSAAGPAADSVARLLADQGKLTELQALWASRLEAAGDADRPAVHLRMAEVCEAAGDMEGAEAHYASAGSGSRGIAFAAADGTARVLHRSSRWAELGEHWARQATNSDSAKEKADLLFRAATVGVRAVEDHGEAADRLREILALEPSHPGALFEVAMRLEALGDWKGLANALHDAGDASEDATRRAVLKYRAAQVRRERQVDVDKVRATLESAVEADGTFQPAVWALRNAAASDVDAQLALYRGQASSGAAEQATWASFAASQLDESGGHADLRDILDRAPDHVGALAAMECAALASGDRETLISLWEGALVGGPSASKSQLSVNLAAALRDSNQADSATNVLAELAALEGERPLRAAARVAESIGAWDVAASLLAPLEAREDQLQRARIVGRRKGDGVAALPLYRDLLSAHPDDADSAFGAAITAARAGDFETLARAHERVAAGSGSVTARASSARWAATLHHMQKDHEAALKCWRLDLELRPDSPQAFDGALRELLQLGDGAGLKALFKAHRPKEKIGLADALLEVGETADAAKVLAKGRTKKKPLALHETLFLEQALFAAENWQGAYDSLTARRDDAADDAQRAVIDARRRWILAEKLAETDAAWELYRSLHEDAPEDREVTEALARIAGARGETSMAIQYLKELADAADGGAEAARYQRRVGEVYERNADPASARQAYLDALDYQNDDREALDGLRRLAQSEGDWAGLIQVHQREVGIADPARALELKREIARVTEVELDDAAVASDAWRSVLELAPKDREALEHLMALARGQSEWGSFVEFATQLAEISNGSERAGLLRQVGVACQEQLQRDDAIRFYEQAISSATPDVEAARRLEELYRARGDWGGTIRALMVQSDIAETPDDKAAPLERAAKLELEVRHDRDAAAEFYERVLLAQPDHEGGLRFMAAHLFQTKRFDLARSVCERLEPVVEEGQDLDDFDTRMDLASFYFGFSEMLFQEGNTAGALTRYERALELNPSHQASLERVGPLYTAAADWKKAENVYRKLLQLTGGQGDKAKVATIYSELGLVERELNNLDKAYKRFNKALELHPNHVGALKGMALVLEDRKDWSNLLNVFNNVIYHATVPGDVVAAYMSKGRILDQHMNRPDKAAQHYQRSLDFDAKQPAALLRMAELAMRRDDYGEAKTLAEKALALPDGLVASDRPLLNLVVAAGHASDGQKEDAEARIGDAVSEGGADFAKDLGPTPLADLDALRQLIAAKLA